MTLPFLLHQTICGAIAAAGFGVLFNIGFRSLPWCAASGALALAVRTGCLDGLHWNLEAASFAAALTVGAAVQFALRVTFTIGAIGTGLAIPTLLLRVRVSR